MKDLKKAAREYAAATVAYDNVYKARRPEDGGDLKVLARLMLTRSVKLQALAEAALEASGINASLAEGIKDLV